MWKAVFPHYNLVLWNPLLRSHDGIQSLTSVLLISGMMFRSLINVLIVWNSRRKWKSTLKLNCPKHVIYLSYLCLFLLNLHGSLCVSPVFLIDSADIIKWSYDGCLCGSSFHASCFESLWCLLRKISWTTYPIIMAPR